MDASDSASLRGLVENLKQAFRQFPGDLKKSPFEAGAEESIDTFLENLCAKIDFILFEDSSHPDSTELRVALDSLRKVQGAITLLTIAAEEYDDCDDDLERQHIIQDTWMSRKTTLLNLIVLSYPSLVLVENFADTFDQESGGVESGRKSSRPGGTEARKRRGQAS